MVKGRLRTFSSVVKLRNFDSISEDTATGRSRGVYCTRPGGFLVKPFRALHKFILTWAGCVAHPEMGAMRRPDYGMSGSTDAHVFIFINQLNLGAFYKHGK